MSREELKLRFSRLANAYYYGHIGQAEYEIELEQLMLQVTGFKTYKEAIAYEP